MSFAGDLEHLPIVDVIQLLHSTRKTGTLNLKSHKGESQLVFSDGYIASANHVQNSIRIGHILVEMNAITPEQLEAALHQQANAGSDRKPLIATLIESGQINKEAAYSGLESLIEMTIVEILTWNSGTFALDVNTADLSDEYRYFPETLKQDIYLNTQSILMDALRIYDERMRDGTLRNGAFADESHTPQAGPAGKGGADLITADMLGLEDLDVVEKKIPDVFLGLKDYESTEIHRQKIRETLPGLGQAEQEKLHTLLMEYAETTAQSGNHLQADAPQLAVIIYSNDEFISHIVTAVCKHEGIFAFTTDDESSLDLIIDQSFAKETVPLLIIDAPLESEALFSAENIVALLQQKLDKYPRLAILQLVAQRNSEFSLQALQTGVRNILSRPLRDENQDAFADNTAKFMKDFHAYLQKSFSSSEQQMLRLFKDCIFELGTLRKIPDVAFVPLKFASTMFERSLTLVVGNNELIAEKGFGIKDDKSCGASQPLLFRIPLAQPSVFQDVIRDGRYFYGQCNDAVIKQHLYGEIGAPHSLKILLMPIKTFGKVIALIYADFGGKAGSPLHIDLLDIVARHAGLVLDNNLYRKKYVSSSQ